jgi:hypothetical protein
VRSNARLYQALATHEADEATRERYRLLAVNERRRESRKLASLFSLWVDSPEDKDTPAARTWRRLLILGGPRAAIAWIEGILRTLVLYSMGIA